MDLSRDIIFRGFNFNEVTQVPGAGLGKGLYGCTVDSITSGDVDIVQFMEKRSLQDGMDAGDVYLGARRFRMAGTLYDLSRNLLYDRLQLLRATLSPTLSFREAPADYGFQPLYYAEPTNDQVSWPSGTIEKRVLVLPRGAQFGLDRDQQGGDDTDALALPWSVMFVQRDPNIYAASPVDITFTPTTDHIDQTISNRGDYHARLNMVIEVTSAAGSIAVTIGDSIFTITVPASTVNRIIRYKGEDKILTVEEDGAERLALSWLTFQQSTTHPVIPPGDSLYTVDFGGGLVIVAGSHMYFYETFA